MSTSVNHVVSGAPTVESHDRGDFGSLRIDAVTIQTYSNLPRGEQAEFWSRVATEATKLAIRFSADQQRVSVEAWS